MAGLGDVLKVAAPLALSFLGGKNTATQVPLETPEQRAARQSLLSFGQTGKIGDFTAGQQVPLQFGDFNATQQEQTGLSALQNLLSSGIPSGFKLGDAALQQFLSPDAQANIAAQFDPFKTQVQRQTGESTAALKRNAALFGNLFSTNTIQGLGDIQNRANETLTSRLAQLANQERNRQLQAIPLAFQSAEAQTQDQLKKIQASQQFGDLARQLNDRQAKARDAELLRRRSELLLPLKALTSVAGTPSQFGVPSVSTSPFRDLLATVGQVGGNFLQKKFFSGGNG